MKFANTSPASSWLRAPALALTLLAMGSTTFASPVTFRPSGSGTPAGSVPVGTFDQRPGNAPAVGGEAAIATAIASLHGQPAGTATTSTPFTVNYQANLTLLDPSGAQVATPGYAYTAVAGFDETATVTQGTATSSTVHFSLAADHSSSDLDFFPPTTGTIGNNATGLGFANDDPNAFLIHAGSLGPGDPSGPFTNFGGSSNRNSYPGSTQPPSPRQGVTGIGGSIPTANTIDVNDAYFLDNPGPTRTFTATYSTPFTTVDPSRAFVRLLEVGPSATFNGYVTPSLGSVNGSDANGGPDFPFPADGGSRFPVPEPASIALTLIGVVGLGLGSLASRLHRRAKVA